MNGNILMNCLIVDEGGTIIPASNCYIVNERFFDGEAVLSDSETAETAKRFGKPLSHFIIEREARAARLGRI